MERLIKNGEPILDGTEPLFTKEKKIFLKLEKLEDIEEELGLDLPTLFKALKNGLIYKTDYGYDEGDYHWTYIDAKYISLGMSYYEPFFEIRLAEEPSVHILKLEDYGTTWTLAKEELE